MERFKIKQLLKRYLEGKSSLKEQKIVDDWYNHIDNESPVSLENGKEEELREVIWTAILPDLAPQLIPVRKLNYIWYKVAAAIVLISTAGLLWFNQSSQTLTPASAAISFTTFSTKAGERKILTLPDGTLLTLNSLSSVQISNDFSAIRNVRIIDGEAFFDVKHDMKRPFIIKSGPLTTQVLGTAFNIRAYRELDNFSVGVVRGKVSVMLARKPVSILIKGKQMVYDQKKSKIILADLDEQLLNWQKGNMVLSDASFNEMVVLMKKNFDIDISTQNQKLKTKHFTATLTTSMSPQKALEVVAAIHKCKIKNGRDTIEIY